MGLSNYLHPWILLFLAASGSVSCSRNVSGTVGKSVILSVTLTLPAQRSIQWKFNNDFIVTAQPNGIPFYYGAYEGRCHLYENAALQLDNLTPADTGEYTLTVIPTSGATQTEMIYLSVYSAVTSAENVAGTEGKSVYLTVKLDLPAMRQVQWRVNTSTLIVTVSTGGSPIYTEAYRDRCHLYDNTTLRLDNLTPTDTGNYSLSVFNLNTGDSLTGSVYLTVYSAVTSAENVSEGKSVYLTVKLDLPAMRQVIWRVNSSSQIVTVSTGGSPAYTDNYRDRCHLYDNTTLRLDNLTPTDKGEYSLTVTNQNTGATVTGSVYLTVYNSSHLSPGAIAGIVIAVLFVVALIPLTIFFILRKKHINKTPMPTNPVYENTGPHAPNTYDNVIAGSKENMAGSKPQESSYQELQFPHNNVYSNLRKTPRK